MVGLPARLAGEVLSLPFNVGCGFAGGGLREVCPKEAIWHFSPFVFTDLHRYAWSFLRRFRIDWQIILIAAPVGARTAAPVPRACASGACACSSSVTARRR